jgi:hypothetical protein
MKDTFNTNDSFSLNVNGTSVNSESITEPGFKFYGHTVIRKNGEIVEDKRNQIVPGGDADSNAVPPIPAINGLKQYLAASMDSDIDRAIDDLFWSGGSVEDTVPNTDLTTAIPAAIQSKDGILIYESDSPFAGLYAMRTTTATASTAFGKKWRGEFKAGGARSIRGAWIGHNIGTVAIADGRTGGLNTGPFLVNYARQTFQVVPMIQGDVLTIDWEIYIS